MTRQEIKALAKEKFAGHKWKIICPVFVILVISFLSGVAAAKFEGLIGGVLTLVTSIAMIAINGSYMAYLLKFTRTGDARLSDIFECFKSPILVGVSRKSMIQKALDCDATQALNGTTILNTFAIERGANILRVHDVKEASECIKLYNILGKKNNENHISTTRNHLGR
jgi:hypothetical protein